MADHSIPHTPWNCEGVYKPHSGQERVSELQRVPSALPHDPWQARRKGLKGESPAQVGLAGQESRAPASALREPAARHSLPYAGLLRYQHLVCWCGVKLQQGAALPEGGNSHITPFWFG